MTQTFSRQRLQWNTSSAEPQRQDQEWRKSGTSWQTALHERIAPGTSPVFVELCDEVRRPEDEGMCGELESVDGRHEVRSKKLAEMLHLLVVRLCIPSDSWKNVHVQIERPSCGYLHHGRQC